MSTFERVKRNILADMAANKTHTQASWARIMLTNTVNLHNVDEQKKFWTWLLNPTDEDHISKPIFTTFTHPLLDNIKNEVTVPVDTDDEKTQDIILTQECVRNGMTTLMKVTPKTV